MDTALKKVFYDKYGKILNHEQVANIAMHFQQFIMLYDSAAKQVYTKFEILKHEFSACGKREPIDTIKTRIKTPASIAEKLRRKKVELSFSSMTEHINDIAGVRVICPYISDIYTVRDMFLSQRDVLLVREKDFIKNPKNSGYRSLHLVIEIPIFLSEREQNVKVEIQLRTMAMDFWASLEHQLKYKTDNQITASHITKDLRQCAESLAATDIKMEQLARKIHTTDEWPDKYDVIL